MKFTVNIKGVITVKQMIKILNMNKLELDDGRSEWNSCITQLIEVLERDYK
jgi:hypothetical protein